LSGVRCGISSAPGKKDLALFYSRRPARAAGVFTQNLFAAAPVKYCRAKLAASPKARAVLINSGCANACTGKAGEGVVRRSARALGKKLGIPGTEALVASTGVIGRPLPWDKMEKGIALLGGQRGPGGGSPADAVRAIMTTDTRPKAAQARFTLGPDTFTVWGCAKGAGMIHPDMATMLAVVLTDIGLPAPVLQRALADSARRTFNRVSVDGDTSTNDSLFLLANGAVKDFPRPPSLLLKKFQAALDQVNLSLSAQIAADGEGATRTAWIFVQNARAEKDAERLAAVVATSPLVKTALHGADPNWGRVLAALGRAGVKFDPARVEVRFGDIPVFRNGARTDYNEKKLHALLKKPRVTIAVDLRQGTAWSHYVTCDYSKEYISINADYTT
jgi:glutamate N-acetyltransferase/amino-acid N-acetyltransferase